MGWVGLGWDGLGWDGDDQKLFMILNNSNSPALLLLISRIQSFLFLNTPTFLFFCGFVWYPPLNGTSLLLAYIHCLRQL
jgi:hypothetical protein